MKTSKPKRKEHFNLTLFFTFITFIALTLTLLIAFAIVYILSRTGFLNVFNPDIPKFAPLLSFLLLLSVIIGVFATIIVNSVPFKPFHTLIKQINRLASGDYSARLNFEGMFKKHSELKKLSKSFNSLASELQGTEMLRKDFINNFSHEFKTPIVSIAGFAKLLKSDELPENQRLEYLNIIEEESRRLADMATSILELTKIENQSILTDISKFNLSEQIRSSILLLEDKWSKKNIEFNLDFEEFFINANENLLKHVWINLIDNAIKFSPESNIITVRINKDSKNTYVSVENSGILIPDEVKSKIFNKFYQADESHSTEGNGIGLAVVKKVVELHKGEIYVDSKNNLNIFTVVLSDNLII